MRWNTAEFPSPHLPFVADRQDRVDGYSTEALRQLRVLMIGAGGLAGAIVGGLARKGVGRVDICDADAVELTNLNRQYFFPGDLHKPKSICLARNAAQEGALGSLLVGHETDFTAETTDSLLDGAQMAICGVDNDLARKLASQECRARRIPCIHMAVNESADHGWIFVQRPEGPCVACVFPKIAAAESDRQRCVASPAVIDILRAVGALCLYAVDSLLMPQVRVRQWNYRSINLRGGVPDEIVMVQRRANCPLCGVN